MHFNDKPMSRVFIDPQTVLNVIPLSNLRKKGKYSKDLLEIDMKIFNFIGEFIRDAKCLNIL